MTPARRDNIAGKPVGKRWWMGSIQTGWWISISREADAFRVEVAWPLMSGNNDDAGKP